MKRPALNLATIRDDEDEEEFDGQEDDGQGVVATLTGADLSTVVTVEQVPAPYEARGTGELDTGERADLKACERALTGMRKAFITAGKALEVINRGRLYRETHETFADYVEGRWEMKRAHAYRLIEAWPVGALVSPIGDINEGQARELGPVLKQYGPEATVVLYRGAHELSGGKVTAAALKEARAVLPPSQRLAEPEQVGDVLRAAAAEGRVPRLAPPAGVPGPSGHEHDDQDQVPEADVDRDQVEQGSRAVAVLGAAVEQQRRIYDSLPELLPLALVHDPGRTEHLLRELRQYANRTAYRLRGRDGEPGA